MDLVHEGDNIWVAINWRHTVSKISAGGEVTSDYPVDDWPMALAYDGGSIWVTSYRDGNVQRLNLQGEKIGTYPTGKNSVAVEVGGETSG